MGMLEGKVAIVTGGTRGIGLAIVKAFLEEGASVALFGSRQETADKAVAAIKAENVDAAVIGLAPDLTNYEEVEKAVAEVKAVYGKVDILANNAGISARESIYDYDPKAFENIMNVNVNAVFYCTKAVAPIMKAQGGG
jgi:3-oxoacyl-[acyl-carrier protein] reductase/7-alpha-hydroxysteroid dehydrogenase